MRVCECMNECLCVCVYISVYVMVWFGLFGFMAYQPL